MVVGSGSRTHARAPRSCEQLNLIIQGFSFFAPFPHQLCVREISCETKSSSQGGTILEGSLILSSPPQSYPSWEGPLFKLKRAWCIFAIIVTTYTSTTTVANEICSLCLLCTGVHMYMYQRKKIKIINSFVRTKIYQILFSPA